MLLAGAGDISAQQKSTKKAKNTAEVVDMKILDDYFPVRAFMCELPAPDFVDTFINFVREDLVPSGFNMIVVQVDWHFKFKSHPELAGPNAWEMDKIKELVAVCREYGVELLPMINLLGHQSWFNRPGMLMQVYPEFDEKPNVKLSDHDPYKWPNPDHFYCKSYCPNHPDLHKIVFACIDEVIEAFESKYFHAGMDEVFDIADIDCPRCGGMDPAKVFADEINRISAHIALKGVPLMIWGDRLLDGRDDATGYGEWSGSRNNTARAIDMIDRSVVICDWHYRDAEQSAVLFALKGFDVITCGWHRPDITELQLEDILRFRAHSSAVTSKRYWGYMQTVWGAYSRFDKEYREGISDRAALNYIYLQKAFADYAKKFTKERAANGANVKKDQGPATGL